MEPAAGGDGHTYVLRLDMTADCNDGVEGKTSDTLGKGGAGGLLRAP